jgi:hypothetical protein
MPWSDPFDDPIISPREAVCHVAGRRRQHLEAAEGQITEYLGLINVRFASDSEH